MSWFPLRRPLLAPLLATVVLGAAFLALPGPWSPVRAGAPMTAQSVCEAQELRAQKAGNPNLVIEIPAQYDKEFPSLGACRSHAAAWDPQAPGPQQPIPFSHAHHAGTYEISCIYCHSGTDRSMAAGVPSVELCMGCHLHFAPEYDELEGIRILKQHWEEQRPIEWKQVHRVPEHVQFRHNRHMTFGIACEDCHGPVAQMDKLYMTKDTKWWPWLLPTQKLEMGWCVQCHRQNQASQDCLTCHH